MKTRCQSSIVTAKPAKWCDIIHICGLFQKDLWKYGLYKWNLFRDAHFLSCTVHNRPILLSWDAKDMKRWLRHARSTNRAVAGYLSALHLLVIQQQAALVNVKVILIKLTITWWCICTRWPNTSVCLCDQAHIRRKALLLWSLISSQILHKISTNALVPARKHSTGECRCFYSVLLHDVSLCPIYQVAILFGLLENKCKYVTHGIATYKRICENNVYCFFKLSTEY